MWDGVTTVLLYAASESTSHVLYYVGIHIKQGLLMDILRLNLPLLSSVANQLGIQPPRVWITSMPLHPGAFSVQNFSVQTSICHCHSSGSYNDVSTRTVVASSTLIASTFAAA